MGTIIFANTSEGNEYFPNLLSAIINMLILMTTANFPDIMLPAYEENRLYSTFFIIYLLLGLFFLFNVVQAIFYNIYRNQIEQVAQRLISKKQSVLVPAFETLDSDNTGTVTN